MLASGHWSSGGITHGAAMKGANLGFRLLQEEIRGDTTIIYRASCSMISYAVGTLSPSRIRFEMTLIPLGFVGEKIFFGFTLFLTIVGDNTSSGHSWATRGGRTRSGWAPLRRKEKKIVDRLRIQPDRLRKIRNSLLLFSKLSITFTLNLNSIQI
jgi:hypothetical protein